MRSNQVCVLPKADAAVTGASITITFMLLRPRELQLLQLQLLLILLLLPLLLFLLLLRCRVKQPWRSHWTATRILDIVFQMKRYRSWLH